MRAMAQSKHHIKVSEKVVNDLKQRNDSEKRFEGVVKLCVSLHESVDFLVKENDRLRAQRLKLEQENLKCGCTSDQAKLREEAALLKKKYDLQTELSTLHKNKSKRAEEIIELRRSLDEKEKELKKKTEELEKAEAALQVAKNQKDFFEDKATEAENNLQLVKDEYAALLLTYSSLRKAKDALEKEHKDLISRWMTYKAKVADEMNADCERFQRMKLLKVQKAMEEAIKEPVSINPGPSHLCADGSSKS